MRRRSIVVGAILLAGQVVWAATLEQTAWDVTVTPDADAAAAGEQPFRDTLIFSQGTFTSSACVKYGFGDSQYLIQETPGATAWATDQHSQKSGKSHWEGTVAGDEVKGRLAWQRLDGKVFQYAFEGQRKMVKSSKKSSSKRQR